MIVSTKKVQKCNLCVCGLRIFQVIADEPPQMPDKGFDECRSLRDLEQGGSRLLMIGISQENRETNIEEAIVGGHRQGDNEKLVQIRTVDEPPDRPVRLEEKIAQTPAQISIRQLKKKHRK